MSHHSNKFVCVLNNVIIQNMKNYVDIDQLKDISCIHSVPATHVVTAISYGADAIFAYCKSTNSEKKLLHL